MANARAANVVILDTTGQVDGQYDICAIKYIGAASGTATIKQDSTSGTVVWEEAGTANVWNSDVGLKLRSGFYVTLTNSAKVYLYLN